MIPYANTGGDLDQMWSHSTLQIWQLETKTHIANLIQKSCELWNKIDALSFSVNWNEKQ